MGRMTMGRKMMGRMMIHPRFSFQCCCPFLFCLLPFCLRGVDAAEPPLGRKQQPSEFKIDDLNKLMLAAVDNSSNNVKFAAPPGEYVVHGCVLDEQGEPIVGAQVMLAEGSRGPYMYLANFDVTDQAGRFVVQAAPSSQKIFVRAGDTHCTLDTGGAEDVVVQLPKTYAVKFEAGTITDLFDEELRLGAIATRVGQTRIFGSQSTTLADSQAGKLRLAPGRYRLYGYRRLATAGDPVRGYAELAEIDVLAEEGQSFQLGRRAGATLSGSIDGYDSMIKQPNVIGIQLSLSQQQIHSQNVWRTIDTIVCRPDGTFVFDAIPNGLYLLQVTTIPDPKAPRQPAFRGGFSVPVNRPLFKERIQVAARNVHLALPIQRDTSSTAARVHQILDSEHPQPNVSWSWSDVQISQLGGIEDRAGTIAELLRLLKAEDTPYAWRWLVIESLWRIRPIGAETKTALVEAMNDPANRRWRSSILGTFRNMRGEAIEMLDLIIGMREDDDWRIRYGVADAMGEIGKSLIDPPDKLIDTAIGLLDDPHGLVRKQAAGSLGELQSARAIEALRRRMDDPYGPARAMAAWALFECSGQAEPSLSTMIGLLENGDHEARKEAAYYLQMFDHRAAPALPALRANTTYEKKPPFRGTRETIQYQLRGAAENAIEAIGAGIGWQAEPKPFALRLDPSQQAAVNQLQFDAAWGTAEQGLELGILSDGDRDSHQVGERVPITLLVRNTTNAPIRFEIDRRLHDIGPEVTSADGKRQYVKNTRLLVAAKHPVVTLPPGGVMAIPHTGLGLGDNPDPGSRLWHPYLAEPKSGEHQIAQRYRFEVYDENAGTKTRIWLSTGTVTVSFD